MILPPPVETGRIVTLPVLVAQISTPEKPLAVDKELENEAIYLRGITVDASLLPKLAKACAAEWLPNESGALLARPKALKATLASQEKEAFQKALKASFRPPKGPLDASTLAAKERTLQNDIDTLKSSTASSEAWQQALDRSQSLLYTYRKGKDDANPVRRSLRRLLSSADISDATLLTSGKWLRYSNLSQSSVRMVPDAPGLLPAFRKDWESFRRSGLSVSSFGINREPIECGTTDNSFVIGGDEEAGPPSRFVLGVSRTDDDGYRFILRIYDRNGTFVAGDNVAWEPPALPAEHWPGDGKQPPSELENDPALKKAQHHLYGDLTAKENRAWLSTLRKGQADALSSFASPFLDAVTTDLGQPVLIDVPDDILSPLQGARTTDDVKSALLGSVAITSEERTSIGKPHCPLRASRLRFPRLVLPDLLHLATQKFPSLQECGLYIRRAGPSSRLERAIYLSASRRNTEAGGVLPKIFVYDAINRNILAFLNLLSPQEKSVIDRSGSLALGSLSPLARQKLREAMDDPRFIYDDCHFLKGGNDAYVLQATSSHAYLLYTTNDEHDAPVTSPDSLAQILWKNDHRIPMGEYDGKLPARSKLFVPFLRSGIRLVLAESPDLPPASEEAWKRNVYVSNLSIAKPLSSFPLSMQGLPEVYQDQIRASYDKWMKASRKAED